MIGTFLVAILGLVAPQRPCLASTYPGANGQAKIQAAINDARCAIVEIETTGPDTAGVWAITGDLMLRSRLTLRGPTNGTAPTLKATAPFSGAGMLRGANLSYVTIENLILDGATTLAFNGIWIQGCDHLTVRRSTFQGINGRGIHLNSTTCSDVLVTRNTFTSLARGLRTDTTLNTTYHARVLFSHNTCTAGQYCAALANCGQDASTACAARQNVATTPTQSGIDFNLVHYGFITGNTVTPTYRCLTIDDATHNTISQNTCTASGGATELGIAIANGAVPANVPWHVTFNTVSGNTVTGMGSAALYLGATSDTVNDINDSNTFSNNTISGNFAGCGKTAVYVTNATFTSNGPDSCSP